MLVAPYKAKRNSYPAKATAFGVEEESNNTSSSVGSSGLCFTTFNAFFLPCLYSAEVAAQPVIAR